MPPLKAFMDDTTIITTSEAQARKMLERLDSLIIWCRMSFKPKKSRSLSLIKGKVIERSYTVANQIIPTVGEEPVKSLGRVYDASMKDSNAVKQVIEMAQNGLNIIDKSRLLGKFKIWCLQFMLIPKLMWPLLIYEVSTSTVEAVERKINKSIRKWLGVPPGLTDVALYCKKSKLQLPFKSVVEEYKVGKTRLAMMLQESTDPVVREVQPTLKTGRKWKVNEEVAAAREMLELKEVTGYTQTNRRGFGHGEIKWWSKASCKERRDMIISEVRKSEDDKRVQKAVQQSQQGQWTTWEEVLQRSLTWNDIWKMAPLRLSFIIRATYDLLPTGSNLYKWGLSEDTKCPLCNERQTLEHVLSACRVSLGQGRYTWRHNRVLQELVAIVDRAKDKAINSKRVEVPPRYFIGAGTTSNIEIRDIPLPSLLDGANDWDVIADLPGRREYPTAIKNTGRRPDIVVHSIEKQELIMIELTVPYETRIEEQHLFKSEKYNDLVKQLRQEAGVRAKVIAVEVGARGFVATSAYDLCKQLGIKGQARARALKSLSETAEKASCWLWSMRNKQWDHK